eukprot:1793571-Amphidinium_carterae.1
MSCFFGGSECAQEDLIDAFAVPRCGPMSSEWQSALHGSSQQHDITTQAILCRHEQMNSSKCIDWALARRLYGSTQDEGEMSGSRVYLEEHSEQGLVGCWQPGGLLQERLSIRC